MVPDLPPPVPSDAYPTDERLDSWKEIAAHLKRDVSTVQRWEKREGLPVHRHLHDKLGSVYAFRIEIDRWWQNRRKGLPTEVQAVAGEAGWPEQTDQEGASSPRRRPWLRGVAVAAVVTAPALVLAGLWLARAPSAADGGLLPFQQRDWVLVTTFDNRTGDERFDGMLEHALAHGLSDSTYLNVVPRERIEDALRLMARPASTVVDAEVGREIALRDGAIRVVVAGRIESVGDTYVLTAQLIDPRDGAIADSWREHADTDSALAPAVRRLSIWTRLALGERRPLGEEGQQSPPKVTTSSLRALRLFAEGEAAARVGHVTGQWAEAESLFASAVAEDPAFASAHIWLAWAQARRNLASTAPDRNDRHLVAANRAMELIDRATPRERYFIRGSYSWMTNRVESAVGEFEALVRLYPDDFWGLTNLSVLHRQVGRGKAVTETNARLAALRPNDPLLRVRVAQDVLRTEGPDAARPHVAAAARLLESVPSTAVFPEPVRTWVLLFPVHDMWLQGRIRDAAAVVEALAARPEVTAEGVNGEQLVVSFYFSLGQLRRVERTWTESRNPYPSAQLMQRAVIAQTRNEHWRIRSLLESYSGVDVLPAVMFLIRAGDPDAAADVLQRNRSLSLFPVMVETATAQLEAARGDTRRLEQLVWGGERPSGNTGWLNNLQSLAEAHLARRDIPKAIAALETAGALRAKLFFPGSHAGRGWMEGQKKLADLYRQTGRAEAARDIERDLLALLVAADQDHPVLVELKGRRND